MPLRGNVFLKSIREKSHTSACLGAGQEQRGRFQRVAHIVLEIFKTWLVSARAHACMRASVMALYREETEGTKEFRVVRFESSHTLSQLRTFDRTLLEAAGEEIA